MKTEITVEGYYWDRDPEFKSGKEIKFEPDDVKAYVLNVKDSTPDYFVYNLCKGIDEIMEHPSSEIIFIDKIQVPEQKSRHYYEGKIERDKVKIAFEERYPLPPGSRQKLFPEFFRDRVKKVGDKVHFYHNERISFSSWNVRNKIDRFAEYLQKFGPVNYKKSPEFLFSWISDRDVKKMLNKHGVYVRPSSKLLEYNPEKAAKQARAIAGKVKKAKKTTDLLYGDIKDLRYLLKSAIGKTLQCDFVYYYQQSYQKKVQCVYHVLYYLDFCDIFLEPGFYRKTQVFQSIINTWKKMSQKKKMTYPEGFRKFMNKEAKITAPGGKLYTSYYDLFEKIKINKKLFKHSKFKSADQFIEQIRKHNTNYHANTIQNS